MQMTALAIQRGIDRKNGIRVGFLATTPRRSSACYVIRLEGKTWSSPYAKEFWKPFSE